MFSKGQGQRLFFFGELKNSRLSPELLTNFHKATIENIYILSARDCYDNCITPGKKRGGCGMSSPTSGISVLQPGPKRTGCKVFDLIHKLFLPLPSRKRDGTIKTHKHSIFPRAVKSIIPSLHIEHQ